MAAQLVHGDIKAHPGPERGFLEQQGQALSGQLRQLFPRLEGAGPGQQRQDIFWREVGYIQKVFGFHRVLVVAPFMRRNAGEWPCRKGSPLSVGSSYVSCGGGMPRGWV